MRSMLGLERQRQLRLLCCMFALVPLVALVRFVGAVPPPYNTSTVYKEQKWMAIATLCVDEGNHRSPDGQLNSVSQYMNMTMSNHAAYARAHGYDYMPLTRRLDDHRDVRYDKLLWIMELLKKYSWVFFTDCDSMFVDFCVDAGHWPKGVENSGKSADLIFTGDENWAINSGQMFVRNTSWATDLLHNASLEPRNTHGCSGNDNAAFNWILWRDCVKARGNFKTYWGDTRACEKMIKISPFSDKLACAPINTYLHDAHWWLASPFRIHVAGAQSTKLRDLKRAAAMVRKCHNGTGREEAD